MHGERRAAPRRIQLSQAAEDLIAADIRPATKKIYKSRAAKFDEYCEELGVDPSTCAVEVIANFLADCVRIDNLSYQTVCGYRSAIARNHSGNLPIGRLPIIKRLTRAVFLERPPVPRYAEVWEVDTLLAHLRTMHPAESLSIMDLSVKTAALVFILSLSRSSSVAAIGPSFQLVEDTVILPLVSLEKTSRPSNIRGELRCPAAVDDPELSLSTYLAAYLDRTEPCRQYFAKAEGAPPDRLFVSTTKPHQPVLPATLAKWLLRAMDAAGIDTKTFRAHSSRGAGATDLVKKGLSLVQILRRANWSETSDTFQRFYNRA